MSDYSFVYGDPPNPYDIPVQSKDHMGQWERRFLELANHVSNWSKDPSTKVGAVIVKDNRILSIGYNGFAQGVYDYQDRYDDRTTKKDLIVHAEMNALSFADSNKTPGSTLYTWPLLPCTRCAGPIIQLGIKYVVSIENNNTRLKKACKEKLAIQQFVEAGIKVRLYENL